MKGLLLIDGNSVGFTAHNSPKLHSGGVETQGIFGVMRSVRTLMRDHRGMKPIVFWDGKSWRKDISDEYKANRDDDPKAAAMRDAYRASRPVIGKGLGLLGVSQRVSINMEADDLIADTVLKVGGRIPIVIVSGDKDLLQLVGPNSTWFDPGNNTRPSRKISEGEFSEYTGYETPDAFVQGKALMGDSSDNIKGVGGIGEKAAPILLQHFGSVAEAVSNIRHSGDEAIPPSLARFRKKLRDFAGEPGGTSEGVERFLKNMRLMKLNAKSRPAIMNLRKSDPAFNGPALERFCEEYAFLSILRDFDGWTRPFVKFDFNKQKEEAA